MRIGMQTQQCKHSVPTQKQSRPLYGSGIEKTLPYTLSSDFVDVAEQDGIVEKIDSTNELAIIKYKDESVKVIDISNKQSYNGNGGFYITNKKDLLLEEGKSFKKGDIIAKNSQFFLGDKTEDITYTQGYLAKVAMSCGDFTLEDSSLITEGVSEAMATMVTMMIPASFGVNTNILKIKKKGQHIKTGEALVEFEHSFENAEANKLLDNISDEYSDYIENIGVDSIISKYTGDIVDVKVYYNRDFEDFSESVQKIITEYKTSVERRKKILEKSNDIATIIPSTDKIEDTKINGKEADGIVIEFYIRHKDLLQTGDKIVYGTAIKTIVSDVLPLGEEPFSEKHPDEKIEAVFSPMSVVSRMTTDILNIMYTNKLIIEMKKQMKKIWNS